MTYDADADAQSGYTLWLAIMRHRLLIAGDAIGRDDERVDIMAFWFLRGA